MSTKRHNGFSKPSTGLLHSIKQAFELKKNPIPWVKAFSAGLCASIPIFIAVLAGEFSYGLLASLGSFTYLYMFNEPYALRAKKLFFVLLGLSFTVGIGTLLAPYPYILAIVVALAGAFVTFVFGVLRLPGPAAIFFVLAFTITTSMPIDPSQALLRSWFVLLGGLLSLAVAMVGWFFKPRGPETLALKRLYMQLADFIEAVDTNDFSKARHLTLMRIKEAGSIIHAGYISWDKSALYKKLYLLYEEANIMYVNVLKTCAAGEKRFSPQIAHTLRTCATRIDKLDKYNDLEDSLDDVGDSEVANNVKEVKKIINGTSKKIPEKNKIMIPPIRRLFKGSVHQNSIIFLSSIRYGVILFIALLIAFTLGFERSYWIPLSCAAVMLGSTVISTFHRSIQRATGTIIGVFLATALLHFQPDGLLIALYILMLTFLTELLIPINYALAVLFVTSTAIFMTENSTQIFDVGHFAMIRITDILIGCMIGLIGMYIIGRQSASSRLAHTMAKTIRSQIQFMVLLFSEKPKGLALKDSSELRKMQTNLNNLLILFTTALGEVSADKRSLEYIWPVIFSVEQLGNLLVSAMKVDQRVCLTDADLAQLLLVFEMMAKSAEFNQEITIREIPQIDGFPHVVKEIKDLQGALQLREQSITNLS
ncbi:FUSC family protein [Ornithinibacillus bavariensis]|uniref:Membrane protein YvaC n=1 Tax=Ornithinibacillus bavariensis TaxID=545502 RepID=A0A920C821_9BACI|nr:FUSC family protein [Ornithinibacillus bavariensis]GIO27252.1 putative membrane protein YvaC [Ornithinibacillus bavariensis]